MDIERFKEIVGITLGYKVNLKKSLPKKEVDYSSPKVAKEGPRMPLENSSPNNREFRLSRKMQKAPTEINIFKAGIKTIAASAQRNPLLKAETAKLKTDQDSKSVLGVDDSHRGKRKSMKNIPIRKSTSNFRHRTRLTSRGSERPRPVRALR